MELCEHWPLFGLRIQTPRLELRVPDDDDLGELVKVAKRGVHAPETMPFVVPWTDLPSPEFERSFLQYHWLCRAELSPAKWDLAFAVVVAGRVVGCQALHATNFSAQRSAESGSWLGRRSQGMGIGKEMRFAVLTFAFEHLGANAITSGAFEDNAASRAVSLATGYEPDGIEEKLRRGVLSRHLRYRLSSERWSASSGGLPVVVEGLDECRPMLGLN